MNLIFTSFHYNMEANKAHRVPLDVYLKNIFVSLVSAKKHNSEDEVSLIVTPETHAVLPMDFLASLEKEGITLQERPFTYFHAEEGKIWSFSFYRLSIMLELSYEGKYNHILSIDSDTFTQGNYKDIWEDTDDFILLYDLNHSHQAKQEEDTFKDYFALTGQKRHFTNYGGEFIAGSSKNLLVFLKKGLEIFDALMSGNVDFHHGDETVLAISAYEYQKEGLGLVKNASPYVFRYWTGKFHLVSTNYEFNPVVIFHLPDEKKYGLADVYRYYMRHHNFPKGKKLYQMLNIYQKAHCSFHKIVKKIIKK